MIFGKYVLALLSILVSSPVMALEYSSNALIDVPADYPDLSAALLSPAVGGSTIDFGATLTLQLAAGHEVYMAPIIISHPYGYRICIQGAATITTPISNTAAPGGTGGSWTVPLTVGSSAGVAVGDLVGIENAAGPTYYGNHNGAWQVTAIPDGTHVTVLNTSYWTPSGPPAGATGTLRVFPTQLIFHGTSGIISGKLGCLENVAIQGDRLGSNTMGVRDTDETREPGKLNLGPYALVNGFSADGVRANYGGMINANYVTSSGNGNNGFLARDSAHLSCYYCIGSGNGWLAPPLSGGNGFLSELAASVYLWSSAAYGNLEVGMVSRTMSTLLCDTGAPCTSAINQIGFEAGIGPDYLQNQGGASRAYLNSQSNNISTGGNLQE